VLERVRNFSAIILWHVLSPKVNWHLFLGDGHCLHLPKINNSCALAFLELGLCLFFSVYVTALNIQVNIYFFPSVGICQDKAPSTAL